MLWDYEISNVNCPSAAIKRDMTPIKARFSFAFEPSFSLLHACRSFCHLPDLSNSVVVCRLFKLLVVHKQASKQSGNRITKGAYNTKSQKNKSMWNVSSVFQLLLCRCYVALGIFLMGFVLESCPALCQCIYTILRFRLDDCFFCNASSRPLAYYSSFAISNSISFHPLYFLPHSYKLYHWDSRFCRSFKRHSTNTCTRVVNPHLGSES